jgi:hypothetical protein
LSIVVLKFVKFLMPRYDRATTKKRARAPRTITNNVLIAPRTEPPPAFGAGEAVAVGDGLMVGLASGEAVAWLGIADGTGLLLAVVTVPPHAEIAAAMRVRMRTIFWLWAGMVPPKLSARLRALCAAP